MFDKLKAMGALAGLMKNQDKIKESMQRVKEKMAVTRLTGEAGGGACRVTVNGQMKVLNVDLAPALVAGMAADNQTRVLAGNLIAEATNSALTLAQQRLKEEVDREARDLGVPELAQGLGEMM